MGMQPEKETRTAAAEPDSSDKYFWHRFTNFYESQFEQLGEVRNIFEFGVYHGASMRWLRRRFPRARIVGVDILPKQDDWPSESDISYYQVDQNERSDIRDLFDRLNITFDLIIEDGSHIPQHQASCLDVSMNYLRSGGLYILEDIHTSHPDHRVFSHLSAVDGSRVPNALNVLLAIQHAKRIGKPIDMAIAHALSATGFFDPGAVLTLQDRITNLHLFKRSELPLRCWKCGSDRFNYTTWHCGCGVDLYETADSMSFAIWRT